MKKISLIFACVLAPVLFADARNLLGVDGEDASSVGIYIKDISTGRVLVENNPDVALSPASVMKCVTSASALSLLGEDFCFDTRCYLEGSRSGECQEEWEGDLMIDGSGDPTLESGFFPDYGGLCDSILVNLKRLNIDRISGHVIVNHDMTDMGCVPQWEIDDVAWPYGAGLYGFNFNDNVFKLKPATGETVPYIPGLNVTLGRNDHGTDLVRGIHSDNMIVYGKNPYDKTWAIKTTMNSPADVFEAYLEEYLHAHGIEFAGKDTDLGDRPRVDIYSHKSPCLKKILRSLMVNSNNLFAEGILRAMAPGADRDSAVIVEKSLWKSRGIDFRYTVIKDGSGLSRVNRMSPKLVGNMLEWMANSDMVDSYVSLFPVAGVDGTVRNLLKKTRLKGQLALKSGSMNGVMCYAGYKFDKRNKPTHVVVIFVNGFFCQRSELRSAIEKLLLNTFRK